MNKEILVLAISSIRLAACGGEDSYSRTIAVDIVFFKGKFMKRLYKAAALISLVASLTTGCAVNKATGSVDPTTNLAGLKTMYVKKLPEDNGGTHTLIADKLRTKGVTVTSGSEAPPSNIDAVVTYMDKWMWDITMYMLQLTITLRDPKTDFPLASGNSLHTSLTRLSPTEMVNEVVENIYKGAK